MKNRGKPDGQRERDRERETDSLGENMENDLRRKKLCLFSHLRQTKKENNYKLWGDVEKIKQELNMN